MVTKMNTAEIQSPDEGPTFDILKDPKIQTKIIDALKKSGINVDVTSFEMYHQK